MNDDIRIGPITRIRIRSPSFRKKEAVQVNQNLYEQEYRIGTHTANFMYYLILEPLKKSDEPVTTESLDRLDIPENGNLFENPGYLVQEISRALDFLGSSRYYGIITRSRDFREQKFRNISERRQL